MDYELLTLPAGAGERAVRLAVLEALGERGGTAEIFPGRDTTLVFLHKAPRRLRCYAFPDWESLLTAEPDPHTLWYYQGAYILATEKDLREWSDPLTPPPYWEAHLNEHGKRLL